VRVETVVKFQGQMISRIWKEFVKSGEWKPSPTGFRPDMHLFGCGTFSVVGAMS